VTRRARWGDAESSLGDAKSSLGDAKSSLGDAKSSLGDRASRGEGWLVAEATWAGNARRRRWW
jgi:hypothetical protein